MNAEQLVSELAEHAVREVAPEQLELFGLLGRTYLSNPTGILSRRSERDEALGIGVGAAEAFLLAVAVLVATAAVQHLVTHAVDAGVEKAKRRFKKRRQPEPVSVQGPLPDGVLPVDAATAKRVREVVLEKAALAGMEEPMAKLLADAIVGGLLKYEE